MADSISEGTLAELAVGEGGAVSVDQVIAKLETDKVTIDIRSTVGGKATKWHSKVGDTVKIGAPLLDVELGAAGTAAAAAPAAPKPVEPVLHLNPASAPSSDSSKNASPLAQSGAQPPAATNPTDPSDGEHRRQPSIVFRYVSAPMRDHTRGERERKGEQNRSLVPSILCGCLMVDRASATRRVLAALVLRTNTRATRLCPSSALISSQRTRRQLQPWPRSPLDTRRRG